MIDPITQEFVAIFRNGGVNGEPCDEWQLHDIEQLLGVELPPAYRAFLLIAGHGFGPFEGSRHTFDDDISELQTACRTIFRRDQADVPSGAFAFFVHQGVVVRFFFLNAGNDPAVFEYVEHWPPAIQLAQSFSEFLLHEIRQHR